ncbi:lipopolysaccharide assembly protein LapB [Pseudaeromonas paramecii]|uniref:Lipopolysaccharide assembly protein B n=1 Tax=Pseudaeromonas paramecii TaxID=2138166 RepID=A0ABP8Q0F5_9GAMM
MLELLFLLLPIAVAYGWYMGQRSARLDKENLGHKLSRNYVAGINFLLSEQPDKAVDLFIEMLQVDEETLETHLALGNLFRQRGEVERAIRIHQNLVARPHLTYEQRNLAMLELARDFIAAGLLDRAESILPELVKDSEHEESAANLLIDIYQQMREWDKAIAVAERSKRKLGNKVIPSIAHFYCEQAEQLLKAQEQKKAIYKLKRALQTDDHCIRARLMLARAYWQQHNADLAIETLQPLPTLDADFAPEALPLLLECLSEQDETELGVILQQWLQQTHAASVLLALADEQEKLLGRAAAEQLVLDELKRHPTMKGFHRLIRYQLAEARSQEARESLGLLASLVQEQINVKPVHRCRRCGFSSRVIFWQCPSCKGWGTIKPIRGLDGE